MAADPKRWLVERTIDLIARVTPRCHDVTRLLSQVNGPAVASGHALVDPASFCNLYLVQAVRSATRDHT